MSTDTPKVDRTVIVISTLGDDPDEKTYWLSKTPEERLQALELIRQTLYGYTLATARLQRVLEVAELPRR